MYLYCLSKRLKSMFLGRNEWSARERATECKKHFAYRLTGICRYNIFPFLEHNNTENIS